MEEGSSVAKAVEKGWLKAGKPKEFSVKIHELPEKNFFGITSKNAKIAIIFEEKPATARHETKKPSKIKKTSSFKDRPEQTRKIRPEIIENAQWTDEMISFASKWLKDTLKLLSSQPIKFEVLPDNHQLIITFDHPLLDNPEQNKRIIRPLSQLLVQTLRNNLKQPLRGYKVIMKTA